MEGHLVEIRRWEAIYYVVKNEMEGHRKKVTVEIRRKAIYYVVETRWKGHRKAAPPISSSSWALWLSPGSRLCGLRLALFFKL